MFQKLFSAIRFRAAGVFLTVHAGLILAVYGLASLPRDQVPDSTWWVLALGLGALYGGWCLAAFWVIWPLYGMVMQVKRLMKWREWILEELPKIIALIPTVMEAAKKGWSTVRDEPVPPSPQPAEPPSQRSA